MRLLIVAPILALRAGLRALLAGHEAIDVAGEAAHWDDVESLEGVDAIILVREDENEALNEEILAGLDTPPALLILSDEALDASLALGLPLRAWGLLPLEASEEELLAALHALDEGLMVASPVLMENQFTTAGSLQLASSENLVEELTPREIEVLAALAEGRANKQIALDLAISEHTVKFHTSAIYAKLGVTNRTEAVRQGMRLGLITF